MNEGVEAGQALTIVARVEATKLAALRKLLAGPTPNPLDQRLIDLRLSKKTHFARWVLLEMAGYEPLLVFESNHDGSAGDYVDELLGFAGDALADLYACCDPAPTRADLRTYLLAEERRLPPAAFYRAYPARSVREVSTALAVAAHVRDYLDRNRSSLAPLAPRDIHARVLEELRAAGFAAPRHARVTSFPLVWFADAIHGAVGPVGPKRLRASALLGALVFGPALALLVLDAVAGASLDHVPLVLASAAVAGVVAIVALILGAESARPAGPQSPLADPHLLLAQEDFATQNQITHVAIRKKGWVRGVLLRGVLAVVGLFARVTYTQGDLGGIASIHFARWVALPDGRLLFMSNFDGTWDGYLGDFIDKASAQLSAVWSNTEWFPPTSLLLWGGARDAAAFKAWTRACQVPTQLWYSAYPAASVRNIRAALELAEDVFKPPTDPEAGAWLAELA
jgi:hypothetical protein